MRIIIFGLDFRAYEEITEKLSPAWCDWVVDGEGDTLDVKISDRTKLLFDSSAFGFAINLIKLEYNGKATELFRADFSFIKIE